MKSIVLSPTECVESMDTIRTWVESSMVHSAGERTTEQILEQLTQGLIQCWVILDGDVMVNITLTEVLRYPNKMTLHIITSTGIDWESHKEEHRELESWAKELGCSSISVWGRRGWEKRLPAMGYEHVYSVFEKRI